MAASCPLSDPDFDIIPEVDHLSGVCPCHMCTCAQHICPRALRKTRHMSFHTSYSVSYPAHPILSISKRHCRLPEYRPARWKLESESSMHHDFGAPETFDVMRPERRSVSPSLRPAIAISSSHKDFPNWGPAGVPSKHLPSRPLRWSELKFQGKSSYKLDYQHKLPPTLDSSLNQSIVARRSKSTIRLTDSDQKPQTTNRRMFSGPTDLSSFSHSKPPPEAYIELVNPSCHHNTTTRAAYSLQGSPLVRSFRRRVKQRLL